MQKHIDVCIESIVHAGKRWAKAKEDFSNCPASFDSREPLDTKDQKIMDGYFQSVQDLYNSVEKSRGILKDSSQGEDILDIAFEWGSVNEFSKHLPTLMLNHGVGAVDMSHKVMTVLQKIEDEFETILKRY